MNNGSVGAVIFYNANPVFNHPLAAKVKSGIAKVPLTISLNDRLDETGVSAQYAAPDSHWLESWNDYEPKRGFLSLGSACNHAAVRYSSGSRKSAAWAGNNTRATINYLRTNWRGLLGAISAGLGQGCARRRGYRYCSAPATGSSNCPCNRVQPSY